MGDIRDYIEPSICRQTTAEAAEKQASKIMEIVEPVYYAAHVKGPLRDRRTAPCPQPVDKLAVVTSPRVIFPGLDWPVSLDYEEAVSYSHNDPKTLRISAGDCLMLRESDRLELMRIMFEVYETSAKFHEQYVRGSSE